MGLLSTKALQDLIIDSSMIWAANEVIWHHYVAKSFILSDQSQTGQHHGVIVLFWLYCLSYYPGYWTHVEHKIPALVYTFAG